MSISVTTGTAERRPPPVGSFLWAIDAARQSFIDWRSGLRPLSVFIASTVGLILILTILQLPGGTVPALPVLLVTIVHHSVTLLLRRLAVATVVVVLSHSVLGVLAEQPWLLAALSVVMAFIGYYLLFRGLDLLSYLMAILIPVLFAWQAANGLANGHAAWVEWQQLMIGLLVSGSLGILFLGDRFERGLRERLSSNLASVGNGLLKPLEEEFKAGYISWDARRSASLETLMHGIRHVRGRSVTTTNLVLAGDCTRYMLGLNRMRLALLKHGRPDFFLEGVAESLPELREKLGEQLLEISAAIEEGRPARHIPGLGSAARRFRADCRRMVVAEPSGTPLMETSFVAAASRVLADMHRVTRTLVATTGRTRAKPASRLHMPRWDQRHDWTVGSSLRELITTPDPAAITFAIKGTITMTIAFVIASVYDQWGGAAVFLLMSMFLSTVFQGSLRAAMMLRAVGLLLATTVSVLALITVFPNLGSTGGYAIFLVAVLTPGAVMLVSPRTAAAGLNYAMSVFFIFTTNPRLEVGLDLIDNRFISVAGASLLPWMVFNLIRPTRARDRVQECFASAIDEVERSVMLPLNPRPTDDSKEIESLARSLNSLTVVRTMTDDAAMELVDDPERQQLNLRMVDQVDQLFVISRFLVRTAFLGERIDITRVEADILRELAGMLSETSRRLRGGAARPGDETASARAETALANLDESLSERLVDRRFDGGLRIALIHQVMVHDLVAGVRNFNDLVAERERLLETRSPIRIGDG